MNFLKSLAFYFIPVILLAGLFQRGAEFLVLSLSNNMPDMSESEVYEVAKNHLLSFPLENKAYLTTTSSVAGASTSAEFGDDYIMPEPELINTDLYKKVVVGRGFFDVEVRLTKTEKQKGLSGRDELKEDTGMLFIFDKPDKHAFWMKGMKIPIDFIWISGNKVVQVNKNIDPVIFAPPQYIAPIEPVDAVLELPSGECDKFDIKEGDYVEYRF